MLPWYDIYSMKLPDFRRVYRVLMRDFVVSKRYDCGARHAPTFIQYVQKLPVGEPLL
jgi:hypothetical protein